MIILGLNAFHADSSAALVRDGLLVAAAEEERFRRIKHWAGFPSEAIRYCLKEAGATLGDVAHVAVNSNPKANFLRKVGYTLLRRPDIRFILDRVHNQAKRQSIEEELADVCAGDALTCQVHHVEHPMAHLASCIIVSPFR